jgi:sigma-E processing peptidase SpoIIGA
MVYEVYVDIYFIENLLTDMFVLTLSKLLLREKIAIGRLICASALGALAATLILCFKIQYGILYVAAVLLTDLIMLYVSGMDISKFYVGMIYIHGTAFALSRINDCLYFLVGEKLSYMAGCIIMLLAVLMILIYEKCVEKTVIYDVTVKEKQELFEVKALFDTGNLLTEPVSGKPVSIIEKNPILEKWIENTPEKYKVIPYKSVGNAHGILEGMVVDELVIQREKGQVVEKDAVIAVYNGKLSKNQQFQMILNHSLI